MPVTRLTSVAERSLPSLQEREFISVPDPDFHSFDAFRAEESIKPGQTWAMYDDKQAMPRYYGRISTVSRSPFYVKFWWLDSDHRSSEESKQGRRSSGYFVTTGNFEKGDYTSSELINMFSHRMFVKEELSTRGTTVITIYPRKGDVWAMFKNLDQSGGFTNTETLSNSTCEFNLVEILADYSDENGVETVNLVKLPNFRTVFQREDGPEAIRIWRSLDLLRFSHFVPAATMRKNKRIGLPKQAIELDPAATLVYDGYSKKSSQPHKETQVDLKGASFVQPSNEREQKPTMPLANDQRKVESPPLPDTGNTFRVKEEEDRQAQQIPEYLTRTVRKLVNSPKIRSSESDFYDFASLRTEADIGAGQIWAAYDGADQLPSKYVRVISVSESPFRVDLWWLKPHPPSRKRQSCGSFKNHKRGVTMGSDCLSHMVLDRATNLVKIYPRKGEVWAMKRTCEHLPTEKQHGVQQDQTLTRGYDLVEIHSDFLEQGRGLLQIVRLAKVNGFTSLFQRQGRPTVVENADADSLVGFSHSLPAKSMYRDDALRIPVGALEVDPACIPQTLNSLPVTPRTMRAPHTRPTAQ